MGKSFRRDDDYSNKYKKNPTFKKKFEKGKKTEKGKQSFRPSDGPDVPFISEE